ncbi:hypothetical protein [Streptosporangium vulgare]|uniref:hypothetical protein n=1 Tax=Streptosporangium vulgare TaxID=46190 RepID=UPI0031D47D29
MGGVALIAAPWLPPCGRSCSASAASASRQEERAEVAAHVHDSVLHTLTLIQRNARTRAR